MFCKEIATRAKKETNLGIKMNIAISAIVMAFDEAASLEAVVNETVSVLEELNQPYEVIIIDDGSSDGTGKIADRIASENSNVRTIHHGSNKGLGGTYRTGFTCAKGEFITFFPADGQFPAHIIKEFSYPMKDHDLVLGYLPERNSSLLAKCLSSFERILFSLLFGPMPKFQGIMMLRRSLLSELELKSRGRGWIVVTELIIRAKRANYRILSRPTQCRPRMSGKSKVNSLSNIWANLVQVVQLRCKI